MCSSSSTPSHASTSKPCPRRAAPSRRRVSTSSSASKRRRWHGRARAALAGFRRLSRERRPLRAPPPAARATACARDVPIASVRNCSAFGGAPVGKIPPPKAGPKRKGLLRCGLKKGVGHPAAVAAAGRPGCSAPATLAPAAGRFPRTIPRKPAGKCLSVDAQKLRRTPLVPADNLEDLEDVAPIDRLEGYQVDGLTGGEGGTRAAPGTDGLRQILCT